MAQGVFDVRTELAKGAVIFGDQEQGVVTEAAGAALVGDRAVATTFRYGMDLALRVGQGCGANVIGGRVVVGQWRQLGQETVVVGVVVAVSAGVPGRVDARPAIDAGTTRPLSSPMTQWPTQRASSAAFFWALAAKVAVLDDLRGVGPGCQVMQVQAQIVQDFRQLLALFPISSPQDQDRGHAPLPCWGFARLRENDCAQFCRCL